MKVLATIFTLLSLPSLCSAQTKPVDPPSATNPPTSSVITSEQEPHHHLILKNAAVEVFEINLPSRDVFLMHRHDHDEVVVVIGDATTVSTSPGQADILRMSKNGQVLFAPGDWSHSVRNIGATEYRSIAIELLRPQTGARNLCGNQIPNGKLVCPAPLADSTATHAETPQFETDQTRVTLVTIRPHQQASFDEAKHDELIVAVDEAVIASARGQDADQTLVAGASIWIAKASAKRILKNNSDRDLRVLTLMLKP